MTRLTITTITISIRVTVSRIWASVFIKKDKKKEWKILTERGGLSKKLRRRKNIETEWLLS